ncbi:MAG: hypothetical protein WCO29_20505 [Nostocales cyanobacterium ELA583]|jgi:hypothetical protein
MTLVNYQAMTLKELRRYILTHREDIAAFQFTNYKFPNLISEEMEMNKFV